MSGDKFVLDTNAVLYLLNGDETLSNFLFKKQLFISIITEMELLSYKNITQKEKQQIIAFINELAVVNNNEDIKTVAIELKKNSNLKLPDSIIAATAVWLKLPLVTSDKQFKNLEAINLVYYEK